MSKELDLLLPVLKHTVAIYLFLMFFLRAVNHRAVGQLNVIDLIIVILLGSAVETAMVNANTSLLAGLVCASTLLGLNRLFSLLLLRSRHFRHLVTGGPILLIHDGQFVEEHLKRIGLTKADLFEALHEREYADISQIRFAVLETDGQINVIPMSSTTHRSKLPPGGSQPSPDKP